MIVFITPLTPANVYIPDLKPCMLDEPILVSIEAPYASLIDDENNPFIEQLKPFISTPDIDSKKIEESVGPADSIHLRATNDILSSSISIKCEPTDNFIDFSAFILIEPSAPEISIPFVFEYKYSPLLPLISI